MGSRRCTRVERASEPPNLSDRTHVCVVPVRSVWEYIGQVCWRIGGGFGWKVVPIWRGVRTINCSTPPLSSALHTPLENHGSPGLPPGAFGPHPRHCSAPSVPIQRTGGKIHLQIKSGKKHGERYYSRPSRTESSRAAFRGYEWQRQKRRCSSKSPSGAYISDFYPSCVCPFALTRVRCWNFAAVPPETPHQHPFCFPQLTDPNGHLALWTFKVGTHALPVIFQASATTSIFGLVSSVRCCSGGSEYISLWS